MSSVAQRPDAASRPVSLRSSTRCRAAAGPQRALDGDRLIFSVAALGQTVSGVIDVLDAAVVMEIELPGVLRVIAGGLKERLQKVGQLLLTRK